MLNGDALHKVLLKEVVQPEWTLLSTGLDPQANLRIGISFFPDFSGDLKDTCYFSLCS
jgi:hypothetical protein